MELSILSLLAVCQFLKDTLISPAKYSRGEDSKDEMAGEMTNTDPFSIEAVHVFRTISICVFWRN